MSRKPEDPYQCLTGFDPLKLQPAELLKLALNRSYKALRQDIHTLKNQVGLNARCSKFLTAVASFFVKYAEVFLSLRPSDPQTKYLIEDEVKEEVEGD